MARKGEYRGHRAHPRLLPGRTRRGRHSRHGAHHRLLRPIRLQAGQVRGEITPDEPLGTIRLPNRRITRIIFGLFVLFEKKTTFSMYEK